MPGKTTGETAAATKPWSADLRAGAVSVAAAIRIVRRRNSPGVDGRRRITLRDLKGLGDRLKVIEQRQLDRAAAALQHRGPATRRFALVRPAHLRRVGQHARAEAWHAA